MTTLNNSDILISEPFRTESASCLSVNAACLIGSLESRLFKPCENCSRSTLDSSWLFCLFIYKILSACNSSSKCLSKFSLPYTLVMKLKLTFSTSYLPLPFGFMLAITGLSLLSTSAVTTMILSLRFGESIIITGYERSSGNLFICSISRPCR